MVSEIPHTPETSQFDELNAQLTAGIHALYVCDVAVAQEVASRVAPEFYIVAPDGTYVPNYQHPCIAAFAELTAGIQSMARPVADDL